MHVLGLLLFLLASPPAPDTPFWEAKAPDQWTDGEIQQLLSDSPWAHTDGAPVYLASAAPIREAEDQLRKRGKRSLPPEAVQEENDYEEFMRQKGGQHIVVAVALPDPSSLYDPKKLAQFEKECRLRAGKQKIKPLGIFPPTAADPHVRLVFPKAVDASLKGFTLELYLPSVTMAWRNFEFRTKDMFYKGKLEL